jgi:hypothetical protein
MCVPVSMLYRLISPISYFEHDLVFRTCHKKRKTNSKALSPATRSSTRAKWLVQSSSRISIRPSIQCRSTSLFRSMSRAVGWSVPLPRFPFHIVELDLILWGWKNLYVASHIHHIEGLPREESDTLVRELIAHATQPKYVASIEWKNDGDLVVWDNTCLMHRAMGGAYEGVHKRDMRRATVHDSSSTAYGLNGDGATWRVGLP